jgi:hypothetical protein
VWNYQALNLIGMGASCDITGALLVLKQTGSTLSGLYNGAAITCVSNGSHFDEGGPFGSQIYNATLSGDHVTFDMGPGWSNQGTVSGTSISGSVTITVGHIGGAVTVTGQWTATKAL